MKHSTCRSPKPPVGPESFLDCWRHFLTPQVWKQIQRTFRPDNIRWQAQPLLFVLLLITWCGGDSMAERFETAKACYIACYQERRRPGKNIEGFNKALARVPCAWLRVVATAVRQRLAQVFASNWQVENFVPFGCDGSRLACPRTAELEQRTGRNGKNPPQIWVTALVHLSMGLLWSWRLGKGDADEREHLRHLLKTLPSRALLVADCGYNGYALMRAMIAAKVSFMVRLPSRAPLYVVDRKSLKAYREGLVYYWPQKAQKKQQPPLVVRLWRVGPKAEISLITNVLDAEQLPRSLASKFYRWRWRNEGLFRTYKRTLGKVKLMSRTVELVHREAEASLLAVQLLLAQGSLALQTSGQTQVVPPSARKVLLEIRHEIRNITGMYLGPRQRKTYLERLAEARGDRRRRRTNKVRRRWPGRADHRPPKPPKIQKMGTKLKTLADKILGVA